jgi:hypothetical protein
MQAMIISTRTDLLYTDTFFDALGLPDMVFSAPSHFGESHWQHRRRLQWL